MTNISIPDPIWIGSPSGRSRLPIVELNRADVKKIRKRIRIKRGSKKGATKSCSFGDFKEHLGIDAWSFFHAAKKTELLTTFTTPQVDRLALLFAAEYADFFVWNTENLRRVDRTIFSLEDFSEAGLAGRFGEAVAYLTMLQWGYVYWDRIATLWERAVVKSGMTHPEQLKNAKAVAKKLGVTRPDLEPDFAFEKDAGEVALMESKGSFVHPINDKPTTKKDLRHALRQLSAWSGLISPAPGKSFAIGTYFRDKSDSTGDPSLIAFVDPPGEVGDVPRPIEFSNDWIRRGNYGAWLIGMGFPLSGNALRRGLSVEAPVRQIPVVKLGGRSFGVTVDGLVVKRGPRIGSLHPMPWLGPNLFFEGLHLPGFYRRLWRDMGVSAIRVTGTELGTLRLIADSVRNSASTSLMERAARAGGIEPQAASDGFSGSIFPDGTLVGQIVPDMLMNASMEEIRL